MLGARSLTNFYPSLKLPDLFFTSLVGNLSFGGVRDILSDAYSEISRGIGQTADTSALVSETPPLLM